MKLSEIVEGGVEINQNILFANKLLKEKASGMIESIKLEL